MIYNHVFTGTFIERINRFIAKVVIDNKEELVHVRNTGRCKEILLPGTRVFLEKSFSPHRKTAYSLISAYKEDALINIDSQIPNKVVYDALLTDKIQEIRKIDLLKREVTFEKSRFDLYFESHWCTRGFIEVKGVTLEENGVAKFPDAPTERGRKHILEMIKAVEQGYQGFLFFLIQLKGCHTFTPNDLMDPAFGQALRLAYEGGVNILCYDSHVGENSIHIGDKVPILL
jgi:sugar fermentation stimulation protein A